MLRQVQKHKNGQMNLSTLSLGLDKLNQLEVEYLTMKVSHSSLTTVTVFTQTEQEKASPYGVQTEIGSKLEIL